ncbi:MAG: hypothetical protein ACXABY_00915 [Candidatus Thorarchaeota archaeon]|jgi:hypothetical protein
MLKLDRKQSLTVQEVIDALGKVSDKTCYCFVDMNGCLDPVLDITVMTGTADDLEEGDVCIKSYDDESIPEEESLLL